MEYKHTPHPITPEGQKFLDSLTSEARALQVLAQKSKGNCRIRVRIHDPDENILVDLPSKKYRVNPKEMISALQSFQEIQCRVIGE